jgi:hypothetical protein
VGADLAEGLAVAGAQQGQEAREDERVRQRQQGGGGVFVFGLDLEALIVAHAWGVGPVGGHG